MPEETTLEKRPYVAPELVVHGDVQDLTQKTGTAQDLESAGSFIPDGSG
jgi:hypothetical protein